MVVPSEKVQGTCAMRTSVTESPKTNACQKMSVLWGAAHDTRHARPPAWNRTTSFRNESAFRSLPTACLVCPCSAMTCSASSRSSCR